MSKIEEYEKVNSCDPGDIVLIDGPRGTRIIDATKLGSSPDAKSDAITASVEGSVATFSDGADNSPVLSCVAQITPVQAGSGDPSPSNVREISGFTGCKVTRTGKNLASLNDATITSQTNIGTIELPAGTFAFSAQFVNRTSINGYVRLYDGSTLVANLQAEGNYTGKKETTFTLSNPKSLRVQCSGASAGYNFDISQIQCEYGSEATDYEPYNSQTVEVSFPSEAGTVYGGTLDVTTGELTVDKAAVDMGTIDWMKGNRNNDDTGYIFRSNRQLPVKVSSVAVSSEFAFEYNVTSWETLGVNEMTVSNNAAYGVIICANYSTLADLKAAISGVTLVYELAAPLVYHLTPREVTTLLGNNNIFADTGDISLTYAVDTKTYIDDKIAAIVATLSTT